MRLQSPAARPPSLIYPSWGRAWCPQRVSGVLRSPRGPQETTGDLRFFRAPARFRFIRVSLSDPSGPGPLQMGSHLILGTFPGAPRSPQRSPLRPHLDPTSGWINACPVARRPPPGHSIREPRAIPDQMFLTTWTPLGHILSYRCFLVPCGRWCGVGVLSRSHRSLVASPVRRAVLWAMVSQ